MKSVRRSGTAVVYLPGQEIGSGVSGSVFAVPDDARLVVKIFKAPSPALAKKIVAMADDGARNGLLEVPGRAAFTMPIRTVVDPATSAIGGYETIRVTGARDLAHYYVPPLRAALPVRSDRLMLLRICINLAFAVYALEVYGYVVCDLHGKNVLVFDDGRIAIIDTDSLQFTNGRDVHCSGEWTEEFAPPELQFLAGNNIVREPMAAWWSLMVVVFLCLGGDGQHPFARNPHGKGAKLSQGERIQKSVWIHRQSANSPARQRVRPLKDLHPIERELFVRCFEAGQHTPTARPSAITIATKLGELEQDLLRPRVHAVAAIPAVLPRVVAIPAPQALPVIQAAQVAVVSVRQAVPALAPQQPLPIAAPMPIPRPALPPPARRKLITTRNAVVGATCALAAAFLLAFVAGRSWESKKRAKGEPTPALWKQLVGGR